MNVRVDPDLCEGHGKCEKAAPAVFELRDDDLSYVLIDHVPEPEHENVKNALRLCPRQAIKIIEE
ncbi:MAG: ferredoxin [Dehalococcoidia bacterium]